MAKYRFTNKAVDDLTRIWNYTFNKWSENQADRYYYMLIENCEEVTVNPELGEKIFRRYRKLIWVSSWSTYHFLPKD